MLLAMKRIARTNNGYKLAIAAFAICSFAVIQLACGGSSKPKPTPIPSNQPTFAHVVLVVEENHSYGDVINNSSMPYLNGLASQYGLATQYFANLHPSLPNYLMLTTGQMESTLDTFTGTIDDDNIVREFVNAGKSWKAYLESIPSAGYTGGDSVPYVKRHDPFAYLSDLQNGAQAANLVPFTQFATDLSNNTLPQYAFIAPNLDDDAHDGTLAQADSWLQTNIAPLITNSAFQSSGLLVIVFDEGDQSDISHGGGQVACVVVGTKVKPGYKSTTFYQHQSVLRLVMASSGVDNFPGAAANAPDMTEFFTGQ